jgi:hypothetical protein
MFAPTPPAGSWVPQHAAPGAGISTSGRSTASKILLGVGIALGLLILIAVAIPVFLSQRKPANRNVVLPTTLVDQQRITGNADLDAAAATEVAALSKIIPGGSQTQAAYYGLDGEPTFMVIAGKLAHRPTSADVTSFFSTHNAADPTLVKLGSGQFGGTLECGASTVDGNVVTICASLDSAAAIVLVATNNTTPSQLAIVTRQVIGSVEVKG